MVLYRIAMKVLCCAFYLSSTCDLCVQCCQCLWIVTLWLPRRVSLTFIDTDATVLLIYTRERKTNLAPIAINCVTSHPEWDYPEHLASKITSFLNVLVTHAEEQNLKNKLLFILDCKSVDYYVINKWMHDALPFRRSSFEE